jgi:hypothetical protein
MDCETARLLLHFARPLASELDPREADALSDHLAECSKCATRAQNERQIDDHLGQAVRDVPVPPQLRGQILQRLQSDGRRQGRKRLLRFAAAGCAAALVLFAVWLGWGRERQVAQVNPEEFWHEVNNQIRNPPDQVEEWFQTRCHVKAVAPPQLNYDLLVSYDLANFEDQRLPRLLFVQGGERAWVYIAQDNQFDVAALLRSSPVGYNVRVLGHPTNPHIAYVVVYSGEEDSLSRFLAKDAGAAT